MTDRPSIDFSKIDFPSDKFTFKDLRKRFPEEFNATNSFGNAAAKKRESILEALSYAIGAEREWAQATFASALTGRPIRADVRLDLVTHLVEAYTDYGLAHGPAQAKQMAREIEVQAASQAEAYNRGHGGRTF
jgi:hypothetical protein